MRAKRIGKFIPLGTRLDDLRLRMVDIELATSIMLEVVKGLRLAMIEVEMHQEAEVAAVDALRSDVPPDLLPRQRGPTGPQDREYQRSTVIPGPAPG